MIKSAYRYYISLGFLLLIIGILWGNDFQSYQDWRQSSKDLNTIHYISGNQKSLNNITYTLPNGLIMFETAHIGVNDYDYDTDTSLQRYVSRDNSLKDIKYIPYNLVHISPQWLILSNPTMKLRAEANEHLNDMAEEFYHIFGDKIVIVSSYRSYDYQKELKNWCSDTLCALPGRSEHQLGLAIDIFAATTAGEFLSKAQFKKYYEWLALNAHRYGWHNTYQKWVDIDTYQVEPRHRRYLGRELATELFERKMTLGEWYKEKYIK